MKIGVDLGGTKIEAIALDDNHQELIRKRQSTPVGNYQKTLEAITTAVLEIEDTLGLQGSVGICMPGSFSPKHGRIRNANSTWLNGKLLNEDLSKLLNRPLRFANDANCLAISESTDGAGNNKSIVFAMILGTGVGGGLAIDGKLHEGLNRIGGEWGHTTLPWMTKEEYPGPLCYCKQNGCIETFLSGIGFQNDFYQHTQRRLRSEEIIAEMDDGNHDAVDAFHRYQQRLAKAIAMVANIIDPDVFVLGGGMSNITKLYDTLPIDVEKHVLGNEFSTPIRPAKHGDSSGVRGAAWLW
ncbi:ROK family protein [Sessilibacter corallicola]|uniref:Fructokinase n=1 Tax=Sessilibacter corallicola TaxID=2904075 RepID=A0ABQ0A6S4_9GAMM